MHRGLWLKEVTWAPVCGEGEVEEGQAGWALAGKGHSEPSLGHSALRSGLWTGPPGPVGVAG